MRMYDVILAKRQGKELTDEQIKAVVTGFSKGDIADYQVSALLMAIYFNGMTNHETAVLTDYMAHSGDMIDLSVIPGIKVDKHSTGGVGDKTTLIITPMVAACNVPVAKMSGRGLGHTGGTVDKLESIPNFKTEIEKEDFFRIVKEKGLAVIGQTGNIAPADKKLYALRDVTATVDSIPLIASSIMSKKLASGSDAILLDVKTGSGAFMKTLEKSVELAKAMVDIGDHHGRKMAALVTNMDMPLGNAIGNAIEVIEAIETLKGNGPKDLTEICIELAAQMLVLAEKGTLEQCREMAIKTIKDGSAIKKMKDMIEGQYGNSAVVDDYSLFPQASFVKDIISDKEGYVSKIQTEAVGVASGILGAGRATLEDKIDHSAGIVLNKNIGEYVKSGDKLASLYTNKEKSIAEATQKFLSAITISEEKPAEEKLIYAIITPQDIVYL